MDVHVGYLIKNIADKLHGRADANLKKHNLTFQQSKIIGFLALRNNEASQKEIENFLLVAHPTVVGIVARMEQNGFLTTFVPETDKRNKIVKLTDKSVELWHKLKSTIKQGEQSMLRGISADEQAQFVATLKKIYVNLSKENYV